MANAKTLILGHYSIMVLWILFIEPFKTVFENQWLIENLSFIF